MARDYARIVSAIWNEADWQQLSVIEQHAYLMLITQAHISSAGTLSLTLRRWAGYTADGLADALSDALSGLSRAGFVALDEATEELLVVKFVKWDGGHTNEKRREAIKSSARALVSPKLREILAVELALLGIEDALSDTPSHALSDGVSHGTSDAPRVVVKEGEYGPTPTPEPLPTPSATASPTPIVLELCDLLADLVERNGSKRPSITKRWHDACRLMIDVDGREPAKIRRAIEWCQADEFWRPNIMSMSKLREKYDQLALAAQRTVAKPGAPTASAVRVQAQDAWMHATPVAAAS